MAALMQQHFAVDALVALLGPEAPYRVSAAAAGRLLYTDARTQASRGDVITFDPQVVHMQEHVQITGDYTEDTAAASQQRGDEEPPAQTGSTGGGSPW